MIVLIDLDSTVVDLLNPWIAEHNEAHHDDLCIDDVKDFDLHLFTKDQSNDIYKILDRPGFFENLEAFPGAIESVRELHDAAYEVYVVTNPGSPEGARGKYAWFQKHMSFLPKSRLWLGTDKYMLMGDILIDDAAHNAEKFKHAQPLSHAIGIGFPYNIGCKAFSLRAGSHKDPAKAWKQLVAFVHSVAAGREAAGV